MVCSRWRERSAWISRSTVRRGTAWSKVMPTSWSARWRICWTTHSGIPLRWTDHGAMKHSSGIASRSQSRIPGRESRPKTSHTYSIPSTKVMRYGTRRPMLSGSS